MHFFKSGRAILAILAFGYFAALIPPNFVGARDINMISAFDVDESAQYYSLHKMTTFAGSIKQSARNFLVYNDYYYGYPFFLTSALAVIPVKAVSKIFHWNGGEEDLTSLSMLSVRQLGVFFLLVSILLLISMTSGLEQWWVSAPVFIFLVSVPAINELSVWWHADALLTLLVVATLYALHRDHIRFGRWFDWAAVFCGIATGTKLYGLFFFGSVAVCLWLGFRQKTLSPPSVIRKGTRFIAIMVFSVVLANPLLLNAKFRNMIFDKQAEVLGWHHSSISSLSAQARVLRWYDEGLRDHFGHWAFLLAAFILLLVETGRTSSTKLARILLLSWILPIGAYLLLDVSVYNGDRYFVPVLIPMLAFLGIAFNELIHRLQGVPRVARILVVSLVVAAVVIQSAFFWKADLKEYARRIHWERDSPELAFEKLVSRNVLALIPHSSGRPIKLFHDPGLYVPPSAEIEVHMKAGSATYAEISSINPDVLLLSRSYVDKYSVEIKTDEEKVRKEAQASQPFYEDAKQGRIKGYRQTYASGFGIAFVRDIQ